MIGCDWSVQMSRPPHSSLQDRSGWVDSWSFKWAGGRGVKRGGVVWWRDIEGTGAGHRAHGERLYRTKVRGGAAAVTCMIAPVTDPRH